MEHQTSSESKRHQGHLWMILCCAAPLLVLAVLAVGIGRGGAIYLLFLLCPLSHLLMRHRPGHHKHDVPEEET